mgnify:FL=1
MPVDTNMWRERIGFFNLSKKYQHSDPFKPSIFFLYLCYTLLLILMLFHMIIFFELLLIHNILFYLSNNSLVSTDMVIFFFLFLKPSLLLLSGDIEKNPGPKSNTNLKVCHWNLNSLQSHNFAKVSSLKTYNALYKYDIICLSETFLDSSISSNDPSLLLDGYTLIRADHPMNVKKGGVCIYFKDFTTKCSKYH